MRGMNGKFNASNRSVFSRYHIAFPRPKEEGEEAYEEEEDRVFQISPHDGLPAQTKKSLTSLTIGFFRSPRLNIRRLRARCAPFEEKLGRRFMVTRRSSTLTRCRAASTRLKLDQSSILNPFFVSLALLDVEKEKGVSRLHADLNHEAVRQMLAVPQ
ncbi:dedicator of cytokinesis protein 10 isoform X1 [Lates japonicus]|uniref:Dedicator of cytokinesis protein 10 isoform X1 n=1 Tax=Lates japonicus TaxID=270547 RepID=A0AAD3NCZ3_LATJO|nr:dedicator of cytokinesis protein 10 isoform X1 [Lates japonicus]